MLIEADARRFITEAIETDKDLATIEQKEKARGRIVVGTPEYSEKQERHHFAGGRLSYAESH